MKSLIVANWKMNPQTLVEAKELFNSIKKGIKNKKRAEVVICSPFVFSSTLIVQPSTLKLGAQNCFWEKSGAFTGEVSPTMLKKIGCQYVILGHSERRKLGETDEMVNKKIKAAIETGLKPILCIGETNKERKEGKTFKVLKKQLQKDLNNILHSTLYTQNSIIIAYEPVWAIGTGKPCNPKEAGDTLLIIQKIISHLFGFSFAQKVKIVYGGSVNSKIAKNYIKEANFQGLLIGGASLEAKEFIKIIQEISKI